LAGSMPIDCQTPSGDSEKNKQGRPKIIHL
jgi:hypothetical protein